MKFKNIGVLLCFILLITGNLSGQSTFNKTSPLHIEHGKFFHGDIIINLVQLSEIIDAYPDSLRRIELQHYYNRMLRNRVGKNVGLGLTIFLAPPTFVSISILVTLGHGATAYLAPYFCIPLVAAITLTIVDYIMYRKIKKQIVKLYNSGKLSD